MRVKFSNIRYDTDGRRVTGLPKELEVEVPADFDPDANGADIISDRTGWCVLGFACSLDHD